MEHDVAIVGAGVVGLTIAVLARHEGLRVVVVDRAEHGAGASRGNAGLVSPTMAEPLPSPASLREAFRLPGPSKALRLTPRFDRDFLAFCASFLLHSRPSRFRAGSRVLGTLTALTESAIADMKRAGMPDRRSADGVLVVCEDPRAAASTRAHLTRHPEHLGNGSVGPLLERDALHAIDPHLGSRVRTGFQIHEDRYIDPSRHVDELAAIAQRAGVELLTEQRDVRLSMSAGAVRGVTTATCAISADHVVVAAGVGSASILRTAGLRVPLVAGNGYSFTVHGDELPSHSLDSPEQHLAMTPMNGGLRVTGRMELGQAQRGLRPGAIQAVVKAARRLLPEIDWSRTTQEWTGPRPLTGDGLPLIGRSRLAPGLLLATGHGWLGVTLAAPTARVLVDVLLDRPPAIDLGPFDPDRMIAPVRGSRSRRR